MLTTAVIFAAYFVAVLRSLDEDGGGSPNTLGFLVGAVVLQIIAMIVIHAVFAVRSKPGVSDERDRSIELRADRYGSVVLATGVVLTMLGALAIDMAGGSLESVGVAMTGLFVVSHALLLCLVVSQTVTSLAQVILYRRVA